MMQKFKILLVLLSLIVVSGPAVAETWHSNLFDDSLSSSHWNIGIQVDLASRGVGDVGGFVSTDLSVNEKLWIEHKPTGFYMQAQKNNSINGESDFGDRESYSVGFYREILLDDLFIDIGYRFDDLWDVGRDLNTNFHSVYSGIYFPRLHPLKWCDGFKFYLEAESTYPDDSNIMIMGGGFMARVGVMSKFFILDQIFPKGLDVDISTGGNDGIYGRIPDTLGFGMLKFSSKYPIGSKGFNLEPYVTCVKQSRPEREESDLTVVGGIKVKIVF